MNKLFIFFLLSIFFIKEVILANTKNDTYINTENIIYNEKENKLELSNNTKINIGENNILIDRGVIDYNANKIDVIGNFYLYQGSSILSGQNLKGDTNFNNFQANEISFIYNNDLKIDSDLVEKKNDKLFFYNNFLTPCELDGFFNCPTWSLRIDETRYDIENDKFTHYDSFLQIADYKLFYLPYFSHYGSKAPRQKGFLTPSIEFTIGESSAVKTPYYYPIKSNMDLTIVPTIYLNNSLESIDKFKLETVLNHKSSGGTTDISINNIKNDQSDIINSSLKFNSIQTINQNMIISMKGLFTNSISTTRSINREPITFEDIYIKSENFNFLRIDDYFKNEISSVSSFDASNNNQIPLSPSVEYKSQFFLSDHTNLDFNFGYRVIKRDESNTFSPIENHGLNLNNFLTFNKSINNLNTYSKLNLFGSYNKYYFLSNSLNRNESRLNLVSSSDIHFNNLGQLTPRIKFIYPSEFIKSNNFINEDSNSISFNYTNQFSDNRFYGNDLIDNTPRIVYGIEYSSKIYNQDITTKINQSYDFNKLSNFSNKINQVSRLSDYALEVDTKFNNIDFNANLRIDKDEINTKEMSYNLELNKPVDLSLRYNETNKNAFSNLSKDTKALDLELSKKINNNLSISYTSNLDLKNNYSPYSEIFSISFFDECSELNLSYSNNRFNDNFNTTPEEKVSITFTMDYLGFYDSDQNSLLNK